MNCTIKKIEKLFIIENIGLLNSIQFVIDCFYFNRNFIEMKVLLNNLLNYKNYNASLNFMTQNNDVNS